MELAQEQEKFWKPFFEKLCSTSNPEGGLSLVPPQEPLRPGTIRKLIRYWKLGRRIHERTAPAGEAETPDAYRRPRKQRSFEASDGLTAQLMIQWEIAASFLQRECVRYGLDPQPLRAAGKTFVDGLEGNTPNQALIDRAESVLAQLPYQAELEAAKAEPEPPTETETPVAPGSVEMGWRDKAPGYIPSSEARKIPEREIPASTLSSRLKPDGPIRYMRKGRRCKVHVEDLKSEYARAPSEAEIGQFLDGHERRKAEVRREKDPK